MPQPLQVSADRSRVSAALRGLLAVLESHPVRRSRLSVAWDAFRSAFGDGPAPDGVSVDSTGRPDLYGMHALIRMSTAITGEARDALHDVVEAMTVGGVSISAWVYHDSIDGPEPSPDELREHKRQAETADDAPIREAKKAIRNAVSLLGAASGANPPPAGTQQGEGEELPADAPPDWVNKYFCQKQFTLLKEMFVRGGEMPESDLIEVMGYDNPDTLRRRITETNKNLCERSEAIGESWTIRERTRDKIKSYYLDRQKYGQFSP